MADPPQTGAWQPGADAGRVLRVARVVANKDVTQVAAAAGISRPHLSNLEAGRNRLSPELAEKVFKAILAGGAGQ